MSKATVNRVTIIGNLGIDPELRYTPSGIPVATLSVATTSVWKNKVDGSPQEKTEWHRIVLFKKLGEIAKTYLHKGNKVYVEGQLRTRKWQDKEGKDHYMTEIIAVNMQMLNKSGQSSTSANEPPASPSSHQESLDNNVEGDVGVDELPF